MFSRLFAWSLWIALFGLTWPVAHAQETNTPPATDAAPSTNSPPERVQTVYIPYTKLREVFEKDGRGVFLPHAEFQKLWDAAHAKPVVPEQAPPVDALITEIDNTATIEQDVVQVSATVTIELLKKGWLRVPLRLSDVALQSATIDDQPARVVPAAAGGYELLIRHDDAQPKAIQLKLQYARAFTKSPGQNSVAFDAPTAPVNRWRISIAQPGVKINVQPFIAATEVPNATAKSNSDDNKDATDKDATSLKDAAKETVIMAFVGAAPRITIDWTPKAEGATGLTALATVEATQEVFLNETTLRTRANLRYDISRATLAQLKIDVPKEYKIVNVFDANVRKWEVAAEADKQRITVELFEPATARQNISIELERLLDADMFKEIHAPLITAVEVGRQQGTVVVNVDPALRAEVTARTGLLQLDAAELPAQIAGQPWTLAYRYAALPYNLNLSVVRVEPRITAEQFVEAYLEPELLAMDVLTVFDIAEAGVFQLEFDLPPGMTVREVFGHVHPGATPAAVDSHHLDANDANHLIVNLNKKAIGKISLSLRLEQRLSDANLLTPTGTAANVPLVVPQAKQEHLSRVTGRLLLATPESLRLNPTTLNGLRPISLSEATAGLNSLRGNRFPNSRLALAYAFTDQTADGALSVERRKPFITAKQRVLVSVDSGVVRFESLIVYDILYSGVSSLRLDVPAELVGQLRNETNNLRESTMTPAPADVAAGYVAWQITGQSEMIGRQLLRLTWERKLDELAIGKSVEVAVPHLQPKGVDRAWGQIVLTKTEAIDVQPAGQLTGIRPIDPQHDVMPEGMVSNAARAFEYQNEWTLKLNVTRYQLEDIKHTSIERALVRMVITRSGQTGVQAMFRLRSAHQRLTLKLPESVQYDSQPVRINGNPVGLERGDNDEVYVPMAGHDPNQSLVLELRYSLAETGSRLDLPHFPDDPAMQRVVMNVFIPKERALVGWFGPWAEEWEWRDTAFTWVPENMRTDEATEAWVTEGIALSASPPFQRDGTMFSFSALKPETPPAGSLRLMTVSKNFLSSSVLILLAVVALALLRSKLKLKIIAIATVCLAMVLIGVFAPTLAAHLFSMPIVAGLSTAVIVWLGWYGFRAARNFERRSQPVFQTAPVERADEPVTVATNENAPASTDGSPAAKDNQAGGDQHE